MRHHAYDAYGGRAFATHDALTAYAGQVVEPRTGAYLLGHRPYHPALRRFMAPDRLSPFDEGGIHRHAYAGGDPIGRVDPTGNAWWDWIADLLRRTTGDAAQDATASLTPGMASLAASSPRPVQPVSVTKKTGYTRTVYEFREGKSRIKHYAGEGAVAKKIPHRLVPSRGASKAGVRPEWHALPNSNGGINYAADTIVNAVQLKALMGVIGQKNDDLPVTVLSGVHGSPSGLNWAQSKRLGRDHPIYVQDRLNLGVMARLARRAPSEVGVVDVADMGSLDFLQLTERRAHVVHAYCFGAADRALMAYYAVASVKVYEV
ncbi:RHS repeat-associated core domain-containing protein [Luteibacter sp. CQ10]|uniref:RHS repeat-associated core domain-containing protein n=1 Tax=Luteibacter sp. CQ10 TaxID=2805821 RepID=UPI0034A1A641